MLISAVIVSLGIALAQPGGAEDGRSGDPVPFGVLVERLNSDDWNERERATEALGTNEAIPMRALEAELARADLTGEQRVRLERAAMNRFRLEPLGGLGVSFGQASEGAVRIASVVDGFPSSVILQPGDLITAVGDRVIGGQEHLRAEILSRRPGEAMPVLVRRGREVLELNLPLGEYADLTGAANLDDRTVAAAMRLRRERAGTESPEIGTVGGGLDAKGWLAVAFGADHEGLAGDGERRGPIVLPNGSVRSIDQTRRRRSYWKDLTAATEESVRRIREALQRQMSSGLLLRGVYLDYQRSLLLQIQRAQGNGEDVAGLELALDQLNDKLAMLDERLSETAQRIEREEP